MQQATDFLEESRSLAAVIGSHDSAKLQTITLFKDWTISDIVGHLHMFNQAAELALEGGELFREFFKPIAKDLVQGKSLLGIQNEWLDGLGGRKLVNEWIAGFESAAKSYATADPKQRVAWAGPDMSVRSSITARQMETWAHGQAVFDVFGLERKDKDRIRNIAHLGVSTFGWTFLNRKLDVPAPAPFVQLTAPSGVVWEWNERQDNNCVVGPAADFCQIVTQTRNVRDTDIVMKGGTAKRWMETAQCFAGPPIDVPEIGTRRKNE